MIMCRRSIGIHGGLLACACLSACGVDTMSAATGQAAAEAAAARQGKEQEAQIQARIRAMQESQRKRAESIGEQTDGVSR